MQRRSRNGRTEGETKRNTRRCDLEGGKEKYSNREMMGTVKQTEHIEMKAGRQKKTNMVPGFAYNTTSIKIHKKRRDQ